jgi:hypothetical protein
VNCLLRLASQTLILLISSSLVAPAWLQPWIFILRKNFVLQTSLCDFFLLLSCWRSNPGPHTWYANGPTNKLCPQTMIIFYWFSHCISIYPCIYHSQNSA